MSERAIIENVIKQYDVASAIPTVSFASNLLPVHDLGYVCAFIDQLSLQQHSHIDHVVGRLRE